MSPFAKIFTCPAGLQILVKIDLEPEGRRPEVRTYYSPAGHGLASFVRPFRANETGWRDARDYFESIDAEAANRLAADIAAQYAPASQK